MIDMQERFFTPEQIAETLQISPDTVMRLLREKELKGIKIRGQWRIKESALEKFLEENTNIQLEDKK